MDAYRICESDADWPRLIDRAVAGEQVLITRDGQPVVELKPVHLPSQADDALEALLGGLKAMPMSSISSVELLRRMYEED